uniref:TIR domain-containing protein n=1 Tax=Neogobius melanostomus TaxID=47308 RepID=A0A8C6WT03_9GOBI
MKPQTSSLFSLLLLLLLARLSLFYSLKNCTIDFYDQNKIVCKFNSLTSIPAGIPKSATSLRLSANNIDRIRQTDLTGLTRLMFLDLQSNIISHIEDGAFSDLSGLNELIMADNNLKNLTDDMFKGLHNLSHLNLNRNQIALISKFAFEPLKHLQELYLSSNELVQTRDTLLQHPFLLILDLTDNQIPSFQSDDFPFPLLNLTDLKLMSKSLRRFSILSDVFPHLKSLDLSEAGPEFEWDVSEKSFLKSLSSLYLFDTQLTLEEYMLIFQTVYSVESLWLRAIGRFFDKGLLDFACGIPALKKLDIGANGISVLNDTLLQSCSNLTELDISKNSMADMTEASLQMLTRLTRLTIEDNRLSRVPLAIRNMTSLTYLSFEGNDITELTCSDFTNLYSLTVLNLSDNRISQLSSCVLKELPRLKVLNIQNNYISQINNAFSSSLVQLNMNDNKVQWLYKGAFENMSSLIDLKLETGVTIVQRGAFDGLGFKELQIVSFERYCCNSPRADIFSNNNKIVNLHFTRCKDFSLDSELFEPLTELTVLEVTNCNANSLDFLIHANLTKLEKLIFKDNELTVVNEIVFEALPSLKYLDLSENPFVCDCSNDWFIEWAIRNKQVQVANAYQYRCSSPSSEEGRFLLDFNVRLCWEFTGFLYFISSSALVLLTLLSSFIFHFLRWQLVYGYYLLLAFLYDSKKRRQGCPHIYDAFVSYNVHDEDWVYGELLYELEERQGWKLCLHHRDFIPGKAIIENITDAIYSSRKTLLWICPGSILYTEPTVKHSVIVNTLTCVSVCSFRLFDEHKDVLILLFLEEISSNQLIPFYRMRKLVKSRTYLSWTQARSHKGLFWEKVRRALECGHEPGDNHNPLTANA